MAETIPEKSAPSKPNAATIIATLLVGAVLLGFLVWWFFPHDDCADELLIDGRKLNLEAAVDQLNLKTSASPTAQQAISERLQFFISRSAGLCRDHRAGRISDADYLKRGDEVTSWFMNVERLAASGQLKQIGPDAEEELAQALQPIPAAKPVALATAVLKNRDGAILPDGATIHKGDELALYVSLPSPRYLYAVDVGTSGSVSKIFPLAQSAVANPVSMELRIPADPSKFLRVGGPAGMEQILLFVTDKADPHIESLSELSTLDAKAGDPKQSTLRQAIVVRDLFAEPAPPNGPAPKATPVDVTSRFGKAMVAFRLNNAG
jgi:hypothetical protein